MVRLTFEEKCSTKLQTISSGVIRYGSTAFFTYYILPGNLIKRLALLKPEVTQSSNCNKNGIITAYALLGLKRNTSASALQHLNLLFAI